LPRGAATVGLDADEQQRIYPVAEIITCVRQVRVPAGALAVKRAGRGSAEIPAMAGPPTPPLSRYRTHVGHAGRCAGRTDGIDQEVTVIASRETGRRSIASNKRARHDYTLLKTYEAGIVLVGNEVKSLRAGHASLVGAFVQEHDGELMIHGLHIPEHAHGRHGTRVLDQPRRTRKLLLHRGEIDKIIARLGDAGVTIVPLSLYFQNGWAKVEIALARGRRSYDKRQAIAQRDADREIARELSDRLRGRRRRT
jgi:SsrA-binding protein